MLRLISIILGGAVFLSCAKGQSGGDAAPSPLTTYPCKVVYCLFEDTESGGNKNSWSRRSFVFVKSRIDSDDEAKFNRLIYTTEKGSLNSVEIYLAHKKIESWQVSALASLSSELTGTRLSQSTILSCYNRAMGMKEELPIVIYQMKIGKRYAVLCNALTSRNGKPYFNFMIVANWKPRP